MRIHQGNNEKFIQTLITSISKDPHSLENWRCLHVKNSEEIAFDWVESMLKQLKTRHIDYDCDVVHCQDNDVLFISRDLYDEQLCEIADELDIINAASDNAATQTDFVLYDAYIDWQKVCVLLQSKIMGSEIVKTGLEAHDFGEIASLKEVFNEAKQLRKVRFPLHVMVVEDDPLTRRLVANAFKQDYALITAATAQEAVMNYLIHAPDIVFLDIGLPDANGFNVLHQIMTSDPDAYVVMFSGNSYLDNVTNALSNGAAGFISKPFKKDKMFQYIQESSRHHHKYCA